MKLSYGALDTIALLSLNKEWNVLLKATDIL